MILGAILLFPLAAALLTAFPRSERFVLQATFIAALGALGLTLAASAEVVRTGASIVAVPRWMELDGFGALLELLIAFVAATATLYSWGYILASERAPARVRLYAANINLFVLSMLAIPLVVEPGLAWIAVELTTLFSVLLVSFENTREALEAAWKYMTITLVGATAAVLGFLILFWAMRAAGGSEFTFDTLVSMAPRLSPTLVAVAFFLVLVGFGAKVGFVPLHTWVPDVYSQAPSPVCALLSGVETSAVLYVILRLVPVFRAVPALHAGTWLSSVGLIAMGVAAFLILQTRDYKRLFAFSTVEHMGIVSLAVGLGTTAGAYGAVWQIVAHAVTKSFCFFAAGATVAATGTRTIADVRDLIGSHRSTAVALFAGALAIAGAPPFSVFLSEFAIARAAFGSSHVLVALLFLAFVGVAFFGLCGRTLNMIFGAPPKNRELLVREHALPLPSRVAIATAAIPVLVLGVWIPGPLAELLRASSMVLAR